MQDSWPSSVWLVNVVGLGQTVQFLLVLGQTAEEDAAADHQDGGAPRKPVGPAVLVSSALDQDVGELDWVDNQRHELEQDSNEEDESNYSQQTRSLFAQSHDGQDEADDQQ